jgi:hypothetical protein
MKTQKIQTSNWITTLLLSSANVPNLHQVRPTVKPQHKLLLRPTISISAEVRSVLASYLVSHYQLIVVPLDQHT